MPEPLQHSAHGQQHHATNEVSSYVAGHSQQQQEQHWQPYQQQQQPQHVPSGSNHAQISGVLYSQNPENIPNGQPGHMYEVNGQYFGMGVFDFLSPQLPY